MRLKMNFAWGLVCLCQSIVYVISESDQQTTPESKNLSRDFSLIRCHADDKLCENDRVGFEAIAQLHSQIDDDQDGSLNRDESAEFFRDDLKHEGGSETFHGTDDFITVHDFWQIWTKSEVYNWTVDDVINWLNNHVELAEYTTVFRANLVDGRVLPRLATNCGPLVAALGIKNPVHRQKLSIKATDVVLFGPPKIPHNYIKDLALAVSLLAATGVCYFAFIQHRRAQSHVQKLLKDLNSLQKAEDSLSQLQQQLEQAQTAQKMVAGDKENLEKKLVEISQAKAEAERLRQKRETQQEEEFLQLKLAEEELVAVRRALYEAERQLEERQQMTFGDLQQWLQMTYEVETKYFEEKRHATEHQLFAAKEMCEKIRRQKGKLFGSFRVAHNSALDETDSQIMSVKAALDEIKCELQERTQRWKAIEKVCGFNIMTNPGIPFLESLLRGSTMSLITDGSMKSGRSQSNFLGSDDGDDEMGSHTMSAVSGQHLSELRDRRPGGGMALLQPSATLPVPGRLSTPMMQSRLSRSRLTEAYSEENLLSDKCSITSGSEKEHVYFDLGGDSRAVERSTTPVMTKSHSEPLQLTPNNSAIKLETNGGQFASCPQSDGHDFTTGNDSDSSKSSSIEGGVKSDERKKKSAFSKLLHGGKPKSS